MGTNKKTLVLWLCRGGREGDRMNKIINGVEFVLQENHFCKRGGYECKYEILYFDDFYNSWCVLYSAASKREFTKKNIEKYYRFY